MTSLIATLVASLDSHLCSSFEKSSQQIALAVGQRNDEPTKIFCSLCHVQANEKRKEGQRGKFNADDYDNLTEEELKRLLGEAKMRAEEERRKAIEAVSRRVEELQGLAEILIKRQDEEMKREAEGKERRDEEMKREAEEEARQEE
jgi:hypothetical protein